MIPPSSPNENWVYKAEFPDGGGDLRHLLGGVGTGVHVARDQSIQGPALDLDIQIPQSLPDKILSIKLISSIKR